MSITKSYNKQTDTYYAYDTTYEWDEERKKKVQHKRCIGKFDPVTGDIIPNGKVGRPAGMTIPPKTVQKGEQRIPPDNAADLSDLRTRCEKIEYIMSELSSEVSGLKGEINRITSLKE